MAKSNAQAVAEHRARYEMKTISLRSDALKLLADHKRANGLANLSEALLDVMAKSVGG